MFTNPVIGDEVSNGRERAAPAGGQDVRAPCPVFETDLIRLNSPCARASPGPTMPSSAQTAWHCAASPLFKAFFFGSKLRSAALLQ